MEYPFKDLLPLDEVLEHEGYYKDWTHLDPEVFYSLTQISEYIKTKGYGVDVRLLIAQLAEHFGLKTTQVVDLANLLQQNFTTLEGVTQSFTNNINSLVAQMEADKDAVIANATVDSEVILARGGKPTLQARLDETTAQLADMVINVKTFGAKGDGIQDDTQRIIDACQYLQSLGGGKLFFPDGTYLITGVKGETIFEFNDLAYFSLDGNNAIIKDTQSYDITTFEDAHFISFVNCHNINVTAGVKYESQPYDKVVTTEYSGIVWFWFRGSCRNIDVDTEVFGGNRFIYIDGNTTIYPNAKTENIKANIKASYVRYPYITAFSGNNAEVTLKTEWCGRAFFIYGVKNVNISVYGKNDATSLIKSYSGKGCEDINLYYEDLESDYANDLNAGEKVSIHFGDLTPAIMKDIKIKLNVKNYTGGWGHIFTIDKFKGGQSVVDPVGRGHVLDGLELSGYSYQLSGRNHVSMARGDLVYPDVVKNLKYKNLVLDGDGQHTLMLNDTLEGTAVFENVTMLQRTFRVINNTGLAIFKNCKALNFTNTTNDNFNHKYEDCVILSGTTQNYRDKKEFINTLTPRGKLNRSYSQSLFGNPKVSARYGGSLVDGIDIFKVNNINGHFRLKYYLVDNRLQTTTGSRKEKYGIKSWTTTATSAGAVNIHTSIYDEIPEKNVAGFDAPLEVTIINGDAEGFFINVKCLGLTGTTAVATFVLEVISDSTEGVITPLV